MKSQAEPVINQLATSSIKVSGKKIFVIDENTSGDQIFREGDTVVFEIDATRFKAGGKFFEPGDDFTLYRNAFSSLTRFDFQGNPESVFSLTEVEDDGFARWEYTFVDDGLPEGLEEMSISQELRPFGFFTFNLVIDDPRGPAESYELPRTQNDIGGTKNSDILAGTNESDYIFGKKGDDTLEGLDGDDLIKGGGGNDILKGSEGNDYLNGSKGRDVLIGGAGADVFKISKGLDLVKDFSIEQGDKIALTKSADYEIVADEDGVLITVNSKRGILLEGLEHSEAMAVGIDLFVQPV